MSSAACLVNQEEVCKTKKQGGFRVINLKNISTALLGKWLWKYVHQTGQIWRKLVCFLTQRSVGQYYA